MYREVVEGDKFLSLSSEQITKLIASEELKVPSEEKVDELKLIIVIPTLVFESVIRWVKHDLDSRKQILPQLMAHVRLPLTLKNYILKHVVTEPLLNNCPKCKDYVIEALHLYLLKSDEIIAMPYNIRTKHRQSGGSHKVILAVGGLNYNGNLLDSTEWYDSKINKWQTGPKMITTRCSGGLAVVKDNFVLYIGGCNQSNSSLRSADLIDLSSESLSWKPTTNMLVQRKWLGVGVINNFVYAVGGYDNNRCLKSAEVFDCRTQEWHMVASMSTERHNFGVGVLNNILYADNF
ncbi:ring canal kelch homolog [Acyrthosiphon pisum]|uniref:BACK domain-containing protein n=1 Tax=Acyrthosiphon pisum TaxID=7029 RepID=A0A8R2NL38_ACYPI|nr:ring canal kelch homolog [Acyrthosiphon pisum]